MDEETTARYNELTRDGYNTWVAEALAERGYGVEDVLGMSLEGVVLEVLAWNGIHGYSRSVIDMVDNLRNQGHD